MYVMNGIGERLGASLRRAPYVWLAASILLLFFMTSPLRVVASKPADASTPFTVFGTLLIVFGVFQYFAVTSRYMARRLPKIRSENQTVWFTWVLAEMPFLVAFATVACGGQPWVWALGFIASTVLFVRTARQLARAPRVP